VYHILVLSFITLFFIFFHFFLSFFFFFFNDTATTEIYTLSLHDALPIFDNLWVFAAARRLHATWIPDLIYERYALTAIAGSWLRSEEHTSELQSLAYLVCRLLLEKKKKKKKHTKYKHKIYNYESNKINSS